MEIGVDRLYWSRCDPTTWSQMNRRQKTFGWLVCDYSNCCYRDYSPLWNWPVINQDFCWKNGICRVFCFRDLIILRFTSPFFLIMWRSKGQSKSWVSETIRKIRDKGPSSSSQFAVRLWCWDVLLRTLILFTEELQRAPVDIRILNVYIWFTYLFVYLF